MVLPNTFSEKCGWHLHMLLKKKNPKKHGVISIWQPLLHAGQDNNADTVEVTRYSIFILTRILFLPYFCNTYNTTTS